ncbi:regulatory protein GemA [Vibrio mimicus]
MINRNGHYAMIHKGVQALLKERMGYYDDDEYRNWLAINTGKTSCKALNDEELMRTVKLLRESGYITFKKTGEGGHGEGNRPTKQQWAKLAALSKERGWNGLVDKQLDAFVNRTTGIKQAKWLTRTKISEVILGLERWNVSL